jgi:hypothetical protein
MKVEYALKRQVMTHEDATDIFRFELFQHMILVPPQVGSPSISIIAGIYRDGGIYDFRAAIR